MLDAVALNHGSTKGDLRVRLDTCKEMLGPETAVLTEGIDPMTLLDFEPLTVVVPLREEPSGVLRVGTSRVLLELVLRAFKSGATPEAIVQSYDTLNLADVYVVVSRYLAAPERFEEYLRIREEVAAKARGTIEELQGSQGNLRAILLARAKAKEEARAQADLR